MVIVDSSVWIDHLRKSNEDLVYLLNEDQVYTHPFIIGELACGNLRDRQKFLWLLEQLPYSQKADEAEVLALVEQKRLFGRGVGWVDAHLIASALLSSCSIFTFDKSLLKAVKALRLDWS